MTRGFENFHPGSRNFFSPLVRPSRGLRRGRRASASVRTPPREFGAHAPRRRACSLPCRLASASMCRTARGKRFQGGARLILSGESLKACLRVRSAARGAGGAPCTVGASAPSRANVIRRAADSLRERIAHVHVRPLGPLAESLFVVFGQRAANLPQHLHDFGALAASGRRVIPNL
jgi:hypothetical protein